MRLRVSWEVEGKETVQATTGDDFALKREKISSFLGNSKHTKIILLPGTTPTWGDLLACLIDEDEDVADVKVNWFQINSQQKRYQLNFTGENLTSRDLNNDGIKSGDSVFVGLGVRGHSRVRGQGQMQVEIMDDDNSCLFAAVAYVLCGKDKSQVQMLRSLVADIIVSNPDEYSEAVLGRSPVGYARWIKETKSWGGGIELAIFSSYFETEIASIDVSTRRVDLFGTGSNFKQRVYLLYSGIHYDALVTPESTVFTPDDTYTLESALALAEKAFKAHQYTDPGRFTLRCVNCEQCFVGQNEAQTHAVESGHLEFVEYDSQ